MKNKHYSWQQNIWQLLAARQDSATHAILLHGKAGIGKLDLAFNLACFRLCDNSASELSACGKCASCRWFEQGTHPDFYFVEPESEEKISENIVEVDRSNQTDHFLKYKASASQSITVKQIRALSDFVYLTGHQHGQRIVIIFPAEALNTAATNALLKKLEEPPPQVLFILVSHCLQQIPATIRSRCQVINMPVPDIQQATDWLKNKGVKDPENHLAVSGYAPLQALIDSEQGILSQYYLFIDQISSPQNINPVLLAEQYYKSDLPTIVNWMQKWCYDMLSCCMTGRVRYNLGKRDAILFLTSTIDPKALVSFLRVLLSMRRLSYHSLNARLFLEEIFIRYQSLVTQPK